MNKLMGVGLTAVVVLALTGCGVMMDDLEPQPTPKPDPVFSMTVLEAAPAEYTFGTPQFLIYRTVITVSPAPAELAHTDFALFTPDRPTTPKRAGRIGNGGYIEHGPYESSCDAATCELFFSLNWWYTDEDFYPATITVEDAEVVIDAPLTP